MAASNLFYNAFMTSFRKNIITLLLLLLVYGFFYIDKNFNKPKANVLSANSNIAVFTQPESGEEPLVNAINAAKDEVLVEVYLLSDKKIIQSLIDVKNRGVSTRVILEQHPFGGGNVNSNTQKILSDAGVSVFWSNPKFSLTHEKAIIIDKKILFVLSQNLTTSSFSKNREYDIFDTNKEDVLLARDIFVADWERRSFSSTKTNLINSPDNSRVNIEALINSAKQTIDIEMEVIEDNEIIDLLSQKAKNATIRILAPPSSEIKTNQEAFTKLKNAGVLIKTIKTPYMHAKLILVDGGRTYVGSINLSTQSMDSNRELGIILSDSSVVQTIKKTFDADWDKGLNF